MSPPSAPRPSRASPDRESAPGLDRIERWMFQVVTHPDGVVAGLESPPAREQFDLAPLRAAELVEPSRELTSLERLEIYSNQYLWRLIDVLAEDFPVVRHVLGPEEFGRVVRDYLAAHPSTHFNLSHLGIEFPAFLRDEARDVPHREFVVDVARLERAMSDVFDAARAEPVGVDALLGIPPDAWGSARLRFVPSVRVLSFDHPANEFLQAFRETRHMDIPAPSPTWVLVHRRQFTVWRLGLRREQHAILAALRDGATLLESIEACARLDGVDMESVAASLQEWFREWTGIGVFAAVEVG